MDIQPFIGKERKELELLLSAAQGESLRQQGEISEVIQKMEELRREKEEYVQQQEEVAIQVLQLQQIIGQDLFCDYCQKSMLSYRHIFKAGKYCTAKCYDLFYSDESRKKTREELGTLPVKVVVTTDHIPMRDDERSETEQREEQTSAEEIFSFNQLRAIQEFLQESEKPVSFCIEHWDRIYDHGRRTDTDSGRTSTDYSHNYSQNIWLELASGERLQLFSGESPDRFYRGYYRCLLSRK